MHGCFLLLTFLQIGSCFNIMKVLYIAIDNDAKTLNNLIEFIFSGNSNYVCC